MRVLLAVLFFVALLPGGGRCQGIGAGAGGRDLALPPSTSRQSQVLLSRINTVGSDLAGEVQRKYGFCMANVQNDFNQTFNFTSDPSFLSDCMEQTRGQMVRMLCNRAEIELYLSGLGSSRIARVSRNCNQNSWALGCQPGWACSTQGVDDIASEESVVPSRAESCRPCCPGFFCPRGLTCMMPCPLGAYCPLGTLNETTGLCDPYSYQITLGSNLACGSADSWADVITTNDVFCPPGHHCPTTTQKFNCSKGMLSKQVSSSSLRYLHP